MSQSLDLLKETAIQFSTAEAAHSSALNCNAPFEIITTAGNQVEVAQESLLDAARQYFSDVHDGAPL